MAETIKGLWENGEMWKILEDAKIFQDLASRYFQEDYQGQFGYSDMGQLLRAANRSGLVRGTLGLNLYCGNGRPGLFIIRRNRCRIVGVDSTRVGLDIGRHRAERYNLLDQASFIRARGSGILPFKPESFDGILALEGFPADQDLSELYQKVFRLLKPGAGFAFYTLQTAGSTINNIPDFLRTNGEITEGHHSSMLQMAGFRAVQTFDVTSELRALSSRMKRAYEERGVRERLEDGVGAEIADWLYYSTTQVHSLITNNALHRSFIYTQKPA